LTIKLCVKLLSLLYMTSNMIDIAYYLIDCFEEFNTIVNMRYRNLEEDVRERMERLVRLGWRVGAGVDTVRELLRRRRE
jgi:hypothetical protein